MDVPLNEGFFFISLKTHIALSNLFYKTKTYKFSLAFNASSSSNALIANRALEELDALKAKENL